MKSHETSWNPLKSLWITTKVPLKWGSSQISRFQGLRWLENKKQLLAPRRHESWRIRSNNRGFWGWRWLIIILYDYVLSFCYYFAKDLLLYICVCVYYHEHHISLWLSCCCPRLRSLQPSPESCAADVLCKSAPLCSKPYQKFQLLVKTDIKTICYVYNITHCDMLFPGPR